jgi:MFS family permease
MNLVRSHPTCRGSLILGLVNGALWSIGNGLTTGTLILYLVMDLGAKGVGVSLILAIPSLVGLLRLLTPALIARFGSAKRACLATSLASYLLLLGLPAMVLSGGYASWASPLALIVGLVCVHQLLESIGTVALWSWFGQLVPRRIRGRYFARRQVWQLIVLIPTLWLSGAFTDGWKKEHPDRPLVGYAIPTGLGAVLLLVSLLPLVAMRETTAPALIGSRSSWRAIGAPFGDRRFRRLLWFGCWVSFFNGVTQSAQNIYPKAILHIGLMEQAALRTLMQVGQAGYSLGVGPLSDRYGNRPVLILSQLLVACGPLFFWLATPAEPGWLYGAWIVWAAFAGLNICLPNLMLKLAPGADSSPYVACYFATTSVFYAVSTVAGGFLFNWLQPAPPAPPSNMAAYAGLFLGGWVARSLGVLLLFRLQEPGAWSWGQILASYRKPGSSDRISTPSEAAGKTPKV